jgi:hypothetical protein
MTGPISFLHLLRSPIGDVNGLIFALAVSGGVADRLSHPHKRASKRWISSSHEQSQGRKGQGSGGSHDGARTSGSIESIIRVNGEAWRDVSSHGYVWL